MNKSICAKKGDEGYFSELLHLYKPPEKIYLRGKAELDFERTVAIVGSRRPSDYGKRVTKTLASGLAAAGIDVVSGLAFGIDSIAHRATLATGGRTIAVLPGGLDNITPASHEELAKEIIYKNGLLISEFHDKEPVHLGHFLTRNRIIAALSRAVIIVEAADRSGSLSTARHAIELGREIMAVPGEVDSVYSCGTNKLLRNGATLIRNSEDVLDALGLSQDIVQPQLILDLDTPEEQLIVDALRTHGPMSSSKLIELVKIDVASLMSTITMLEMKGALRCQGGEVLIG